MMRLKMYEILLRVPLFTGMSSSELEEIIAQTKFEFIRYKPQQTIIKKGDKCESLLLMFSGCMDCITEDNQQTFRFHEEHQGSYLIEPEHLFGLRQNYGKTFIAKEETDLLILSKNEVLKLSTNYIIFKINLLNIISTKAQITFKRYWNQNPQDIELKIIEFIEAHCDRPSGKKIIDIKMTKLAGELCQPRLKISNALRRLQNTKLINLKRGKIIINEMQDLINHKNHQLSNL